MKKNTRINGKFKTVQKTHLCYFFIVKFFQNAISKIQTGSKDNISLDQLDTFAELVLQFRISDALGGLHHLAQELFKSPHTSNDASCIISIL